MSRPRPKKQTPARQRSIVSGKRQIVGKRLIVGICGIALLGGAVLLWRISRDDARIASPSVLQPTSSADAAPHPRFRPRRIARGAVAAPSAPPSSHPSGSASTDVDADPAAANKEDERRLQHLADNELDVEDYASARRAAQDCLSMNPANRECFRSELLSYTRTGDFAMAQLLLDECLLDEPDDVDCLGAMVTQNLRRGDLVSARTHADRLRVLAPDASVSELADAQIADRSGDHARALALYERACAGWEELACVRAEALRSKLDAGDDARAP